MVSPTYGFDRQLADPRLGDVPKRLELGTAEAAERLCLSPKTIDAHRQKIKRKPDIDSNGELVRFAVERVLQQTQG